MTDGIVSALVIETAEVAIGTGDPGEALEFFWDRVGVESGERNLLGMLELCRQDLNGPHWAVARQECELSR